MPLQRKDLCNTNHKLNAARSMLRSVLRLFGFVLGTMHAAATLAADEAPRKPVEAQNPAGSPQSVPACDGASATGTGEVQSPSVELHSVRCHLQQGSKARAILLLQRLVAQDPANLEAAALLNEQLAKAASLPSPPPPAEHGSLSGWISAEAGHDSNINRATSAKVIDVPLLNYRSLALPDLLVQRRSGFAGLQAGMAYRMPLATSVRADLQAQASLRANFAETSYLPHNYSVSASVAQSWDKTTIGVSALMAQQWVAGYRLLERRGFRLHADITPSPNFVGGVSAEWADNIYPLFESLRTRENSLELRARYSPLNCEAAAFWGEETAPGSIKDLDRTFSGIRLGWRQRITESAVLAIDVATGRSGYRQFSRLFAAQRKDRQADFALALHVRLGRSWSATPRIIIERNDSSMALNGYRRTQYLAELRKDF